MSPIPVLRSLNTLLRLWTGGNPVKQSGRIKWRRKNFHHELYNGHLVVIRVPLLNFAMPKMPAVAVLSHRVAGAIPCKLCATGKLLIWLDHRLTYMQLFRTNIYVDIHNNSRVFHAQPNYSHVLIF